MKIENLKELQKLISACRRLGVQAIKLGEVEFSLGPLPQSKLIKPSVVETFPEENIKIPQFTPTLGQTAVNTVDYRGVQQIADIIATEELSEEQLLFYSSADRLETQQQ